MSIWLRKQWQANRGFVLFIFLMFVFRSAFADWNSIPSGSMKPTLIEGDRILVNKIAYDLRVPFTMISLYRHSDPERGDVVVFDSDRAGKRLVKRVIGVPGDVVAMTNNVLEINGQPLEYLDISREAGAVVRDEDLLGVVHRVRVRSATAFSTFGPVRIPDGAYLMLGDNRDDSADSRVVGLVPRDEIVGRTRSVVMSLDYDNYYLPRGDRFFRSL